MFGRFCSSSARDGQPAARARHGAFGDGNDTVNGGRPPAVLQPVIATSSPAGRPGSLPPMRTPRVVAIDRLHAAWDRFGVAAGLHVHSRRARRFAAFGPGSLICFPWAALYGEEAIRIGRDTLIGPFASLSAGMVPGQPLVSDRIVTIGDRCVIGRGTSVVGHLEVEIGDDVFTGPNVYITDQNHVSDDPASRSGARPRRAAGADRRRLMARGRRVVLPGATIGSHVVVGAGAVVTDDLPDHVVAVGSPARVVGEARPHARAPPG